MNTNLYNRVKELALSIEKFRQLDPTEQEWLKDLLQNGRAVLSCLELLSTIEDESLNYAEIAQVLGQSEETVKQKLNALIDGGISIKKERDGRFINPQFGGRPRRLCRKK